MASIRYKTFGYAAPSAGAHLQPFSFEHRVLRQNDVAMEILCDHMEIARGRVRHEAPVPLWRPGARGARH
jgi:hypothetical protein